MGYFSYNRLSNNFRLSLASSVDSSQSYPYESLRSFWVSITFLKVGSFSITRIHCRFPTSTFLSSFLYTGRRAFSALIRATFSVWQQNCHTDFTTSRKRTNNNSVYSKYPQKFIYTHSWFIPLTFLTNSWFRGDERSRNVMIWCVNTVTETVRKR